MEVKHNKEKEEIAKSQRVLLLIIDTLKKRVETEYNLVQKWETKEDDCFFSLRVFFKPTSYLP